MHDPSPLQQLQDWIREYQLYRHLRTQEDPEPEFRQAPLPPETAQDFHPPREGQLRLWPARSGGDEPFYGLLLQAGYGEWEVVPVSPLALPATPEELLLRTPPPVQVLQLWNAARLPAAQVRNSWTVDTLSPFELAAVQQLRLLPPGESVPPALSGRTGPPLRHPLDPRHAYLAEEADRRDRCLGESLAAGSAAWLLAAEPAPDLSAAPPEPPDAP